MQDDHRPRKRFGQNFLRDQSVIERILEAARLDGGSRVLEIGPGLGALTDRLLESAGRVEVMEIDRDLVTRLEERRHPRLGIHQGDALLLSWDEVLREPPYTLVANLPYNISSQILFRILDCRHLFERLVLMFQKEVGERLCAAPGTGEYGILSVLCPLWFDIRRVVLVRPGAFFPPPKVDSVVLAFEALPAPRAAVADEAFFRRVVKAAFAQRRKTLRNTLKAAGFAEVDVLAALGDCAIDPQARGETLSLEQFARLSAALRP
ncbi:16S rRNA (adenine(1518)-N(6)/adenine(1519)-N(6))-dimethyltransferase RsmA [Geoalkalibacter sp.]|uniref:16S rRNA (adenine(1518)-N(6)/adenine(1519)-N(6))- dimethyltransferase RsmA n=1 Tax=Geoalkalibacter sp. TaxID=3041440 RepID=UPI00272EC0D2|nr:16S rRNA (adenine(1518)-N(6)/adenine(1519)-N(6))-dimethyltransferase RsmA [Geoalkalibacter sp.]